MVYRDKPGRPNRSKALAFIMAHLHDEDGPCVIWPFYRTKRGYARVLFKKRNRHASRIMCEFAHGAPPTPEHEAAHRCGNGHLGCIHPKHLRWATPQENSDDAIAHGRTQKGTKSWCAIVTPDQVREIRQLHGAMPDRAIAEKYGLSHKSIYAIANRVTWAWLE